jgi:dienelactone hydrolase
MSRPITAIACTLALALTVPRAAAQEIEPIDVGSGLVAHLFRPAGEGPHPAVLIVGGSGGGIGWQDEIGQLLARRGFVTLALAYFGMEGLPEALERIPLEYVEHGLTYLRLQPDVDSLRLGMAGVSKGGELALLVSSMHPEVRAVAAFVPSGVVFPSIGGQFAPSSSWSYRGREVPYVPYGDAGDASNIIDYYVSGLQQADSSTVAAATIPVERINGPVLLLSGRDDNLWPSTRLGDMIIERLDHHQFPHENTHVAYEDAGHLISNIREEDVSRRGGTEEGNRRAQVDAQQRFLDFWERHFRR